jgi:hypothetical protein
MTFRFVAISSAIAVASLVTAPSARGECFVLTAKYVMEAQDVELVFSGTVVDTTRSGELGYRATFAVDRIWKGSVAKRLDLYVSEGASEMPHILIGEHYVAAAKRLRESRVRQAVGLGETDAIAFMPSGCSGELSPDIVRELGVGQPPK